jgi:signal transduction histidine kinase
MGMNRHPTPHHQSAGALLMRLSRSAATGRAPFGPFAKHAVLCSYVVLLGLSYYLAARLGLRFRFHNSQIGVVWPANAIFLSALLLTPRTRWWLVLAATALAHTAAMAPLVPVWRLLWQIAGNSVFAIATVEVLRRSPGLPLHFENRRQVLAYTAISFVLPWLFGFTTPAFILSVLHVESTITPAFALLRTMLSNSTAMLLVAPVILLWANFGFRRLRGLRKAQLFEAGALLISLLAVGTLALGTGPEIARLPWLLLWVFPPLLWAAVRFGPLGAVTSLFFIAALSILGASRELGPFVLGTGAADQILSLQLFWMILYLPVTLLAASIRERELTEHALHAQRNQLAHVTRVATAGEFSAAIAHELRQPLASILMNAQTASKLLAKPAPNLGELRDILKDIVEQNKQAADIISHLQSFVRKDDSRFETVALAKVVRDAIALGHNVIAHSGAHLQTQIAGGLPGVHGDSVQLLQVVLNLIVNACESMNGIPKSDRRLVLQLKQMSHHRLELLVSDCGVGLPVDSKERLFEPFFTTKKKGLGLGLTISRSIATAHGGRLWGENNPEGGATFHLQLPTDISTGPPDGPKRPNFRSEKWEQSESPSAHGLTNRPTRETRHCNAKPLPYVSTRR